MVPDRPGASLRKADQVLSRLRVGGGRGAALLLA